MLRTYAPINKKRLKEQLKKDEGYTSEPEYLKIKKLPDGTFEREDHQTVGHGHKVLPGMKFPTFPDGGFDTLENVKKTVFDKLLDEDMAIAIQDAKSLIGEDHPPEILEGFSNMAFQIGKTKLSKFVETIKFIKNNNYMEASIEMLDSDWADQTPERATRISTLFQEAK
tara:strand:- start:60 stop:566 length:507 start_codon:yes stop_codon:yes gene_type:complete